MASSSGLITQPWSLLSRDRPLLPPHPFFIALIFSALCSVGAWWIAKELINQRRKKKRENLGFWRLRCSQPQPKS